HTPLGGVACRAPSAEMSAHLGGERADARTDQPYGAVRMPACTASDHEAAQPIQLGDEVRVRLAAGECRERVGDPGHPVDTWPALIRALRSEVRNDPR